MQFYITIALCFFTMSTSMGATFYIDPANGNINNNGSFDSPWSTLQEVLDNNKVESYENTSHPFDLAINQLVIKNEGAPISAGDTLILRGGLHGEVFLQNYNNTSNITILAQSGHVPILKNIKLQGCKFWKFEGVTISSEPYGEYIQSNLVFLESHSWQGPTSRIEIKNCTVYSTEMPWTTAADWVSKASNGIFIKGDSMDVINNQLMNIDMGITASGDFINAIGNEIINFSGDGMRMLGSNIIFERNLIKNCYAVDDNHDDGIQSFTTVDNPFENNIIRSNIILNYDNPDQPLLGPLQGIGCFDGFFNHWIIENNLVYVNHWHGITLLGANDCQIINNTVIDPTPSVTPGASWITIDDHKNGTASTNCVIKNNVSNQFPVTSGVTVETNIVLNDFADYINNFVDPTNLDFHLLPSSPLVDSADDSIAPDVDIEGITRPQGMHSDIGCYEYVVPVASEELLVKKLDVTIFPNPVFNKFQLTIQGASSIYDLEILDATGLVRQKIMISGLSKTIDISTLANGIYFVKIIDRKNHSFWTEKVIKTQ